MDEHQRVATQAAAWERVKDQLVPSPMPTYDEMVAREGGYYLSWSPHDPSEQVYFVVHCSHCGASLSDEGDGFYVHHGDEGRECWDRRRKQSGA